MANRIWNFISHTGKHEDAPSTEPLSEHDPGTPDAMLHESRRRGREAARAGIKTPPIRRTINLTEWWLGWYDVRLARFYCGT